MKGLIAKKWLGALAVALFMFGTLWYPNVSSLVVGICGPVVFWWAWNQLKVQLNSPPPRSKRHPPRSLATVQRLMYLCVKGVSRFLAKSPYRLLILLIMGALVSIFGVLWGCFHPTKHDSRTGFGVFVGPGIFYSAAVVWYAGRIRDGTWRQFWQQVIKYYP